MWPLRVLFAAAVIIDFFDLSCEVLAVIKIYRGAIISNARILNGRAAVSKLKLYKRD